MNELTELERAVLRKLLEGEHPLLKQLREQLSVCSASRREHTGAGFYTHFDVGDARSEIDVSARFGDVIADIEGMDHGAGFVLYIKHGRLSMLEGYSYDEPWPAQIDSFALRYSKGDERDWTALNELLN